MKTLSFDILEGWPSSAETWKYMQEMMQQLEGIGFLAGDNVILKGCEDGGGIIAPGIVFMNGEVLPFEGGNVAEKVIVVTEAETKEFEGGQLNPYYLRKKVVFGSGAGEVVWATFKRNNHNNGVLARLDRVEKMLKPLIGYDVAGTMVYGSWLFWGRPASEIPAGWEAVPDAEWKGRVPVVLNDADPDFNVVGAIGGLKQVAIQRQHLPKENLNGVDASVQTIVQPGQTGLLVKTFAGQSSTIKTTDAEFSGQEPDLVNIYQIPNLGNGVELNIQNRYKVVMFIRFIA